MNESDNMESFLKNTKGLAKNPLGIIALFISLIYGFACLVLGIAGKNLEKYEKLVLVIFLVVFPILVLICFMVLVTKHHRKLYAPSDFRDEKIYLETIDIMTQKSHIQNQVIESKDQGKSVNEPSSENHTQIFRSYLVVENLILRLVEKNYNLPLRRNIKFKGHESTFDCIIEGKDIFVAAEIKYYLAMEEKHIENVSLHLRRRYHTFQRIAKEFYPDKKRKFILYIVHDNNIDNFKKSIVTLFENENALEAEIRFYEYKLLLEKFGFDAYYIA